MELPDNKLKLFALFFVAEALSFFVICANMRAVAQGHYFWTSVTDTLFSAQSFLLAKLMIDNTKARGWAAGLGTTLGGTTGSLLSIFVTKHLYGA